MGRTKRASIGGAAARAVIDELIVERKVLARAQARNAELVVAFADTRAAVDRPTICGLRGEGVDARFKAGEFAANEISMACSTSKFNAQRLIAMTRRVRAEAPDAWDAWRAGDIDQDKVERINRALRRLQRDRSKIMLNALVVDVAVCKSPEILARWLNQFILETESDLQDERLRRSFDDRYVSVRPDLDGMNFLTAELSAVDANAIDQVLNALAGIAEPGDTRTVQQRRADALVDVVLGRVTNGCHVQWDTNTDTDDHLDDPVEDGQGRDNDGTGDKLRNRDLGSENSDDHEHGGHGTDDHCSGIDGDHHGNGADGAGDHGNGAHGNSHSQCDDGADHNGDGLHGESHIVGDCDSSGGGDHGDPVDGADPRCTGGSTVQAWDADDWEQPASAFRPDPHNVVLDTDLDSGAALDEGLDTTGEIEPEPDGTDDTATAPSATPLAVNSRSGTYPTGRTRVTSCPGGGQPRPLPVTIGIVVTAQSLFGYSNMPGQLMDRSASVPADQIRELAHHKGTLFYRLMTDDKGNLLDVTELGRFPSRKLAMAVKFRDGTCTGPTCTIPATRCDIDHIIPVPEGPTTGRNLNNDCRNEHRAKTHAGHKTARTGPHTTQWTTPTGHQYTTTDMPFPVDKWPTDDDKQQD